ncbi:MAG: methyltransferase domain-containing protein [Phycisphaerales bacterium]|nr:MAG: methyltransferase domain-containing protein [Phycisphaerales bacterium]
MSQDFNITLGDIGFDYTSQVKEHVSRCNVCGSSRSIVISRKDRYGLDVSACLCLGCGLVYLSPRMTVEGYRVFYQKYYRPLVSYYLKQKIDTATIIAGQRQYARELFGWIERYLSPSKDVLEILDVGGSTGVVTKVFKENLEALGFSVKATVIDPSPEELAVAKMSGLETIEGLVEEKNIHKRRWDIVLLCQTIDHLMDVAKTIIAIRSSLRERSLFFVDIVDWEYVVRRKGVQDSLKIDHPFNFTRQTAIPFLEGKGFRIVSESVLSDGHLIGLLCAKAEERPSSFSPGHAEFLLSLIREKQALSQ